MSATQLSSPAPRPSLKTNNNIKQTHDRPFAESDEMSVGDGGSDDVLGLVRQLNLTMDSAIDEINEINSRTKLLALNARIEAARAGSYGAAFGVVAAEMQKLASNTTDAANQMASRTQRTIQLLLDLIGTSVRGNRLSDMALVNIDLIDRNLYERSCDVRWWATDSSVVDALSEKTAAATEHACGRLGTILNSYTVYWDLVLADTKGKVIANGRPDRYRSIDRDVSRAVWFDRAMTTRSGEDFAFETAHKSSLVNDEASLIYSAAVRQGGRVDGSILGVLGIIFNWDALAQSVIENTPLREGEKETTRVMIVDEAGRVLADSGGQAMNESVPSSWMELVKKHKRFSTISIDGIPFCLGFAHAPGYETYTTGWNSLIMQSIGKA
ncbi:Methyl-accepting chemotaxis protein McpA [Rubripirellula tenax]|uniref:Methyl-accepting chemotaxis protein McpA n=1 Tax=Rubripirellula tenax TaxID=2528015 RepID=A0A5C6F5V7_9BACT|nr:methyl-accepting chemotaxis protein [Rubripirellula tenax]TWU56615.1 Methyl-accepting chemotaxis protein McpA [Rubripirellula tenax]